MKVAAKINRMIVKDEKGYDVVGGKRPYQLEIKAGIFCFSTTWLSATDEKSEQVAKDVFSAIAEHLQGSKICQTETPTPIQVKKTKKLPTKKKVASKKQSEKPNTKKK